MNDLRDRSLSEEELRNEVVHRSNRGESKRRISIQLSVSRWKVTEILRRYRKNREASKPNEPLSPDAPSQVAPSQVASHQDAIPQSLGRPIQKRESKLDKFEPQIQQLRSYTGVVASFVTKPRWAFYRGNSLLRCVYVSNNGLVVLNCSKPTASIARMTAACSRIIAWHRSMSFGKLVASCMQVL